MRVRVLSFLSKSVNFFSYDSFLSSLKKRLSYLFSYYFYKNILFPNVISINTERTERGRYSVSVRGFAPSSSVRGFAPIGSAASAKVFGSAFFKKRRSNGMLAFFFPLCAFFLGDSKKKGQLFSGTFGAECNEAFARGEGAECNSSFVRILIAPFYDFICFIFCIRKDWSVRTDVIF